jgi:hypothetical protein
VIKEHLVKIKAMLAAEVCVHFDLNKESQALLGDGMRPREFLEALLKNRQCLPGIDFLAHALPPREAIWWGCVCMQHTCGNNLSAPERAASLAAVQWVLKPTEENRMAAKGPAQTVGVGSPSGSLAMAANQTGGSLAPPNLPLMPPEPFAPAKAVALAITVASVNGDRTKIPDTQRSFVELGIGVAEGRYVWPEIRNRTPVRK